MRDRRGPAPRVNSIRVALVRSGIALVAPAAMHIVAQHFVVHRRSGLRTYGEVLSYIAKPVIFVLETGFR